MNDHALEYHVEQNETGKFDVVEKEHSTTIVLNTTEKKAKEVRRKLSLGKGFNGFTPPFFAKTCGKTILKGRK